VPFAQRTESAQRTPAGLTTTLMLASFPWTTRCAAKPTRTPSARSV
jgi:hypothetical protein